MFCANCGAPVPEGHRYCEKCGAPINPGAVNVGTAGGSNVAAAGSTGTVGSSVGTTYNAPGAGYNAGYNPVNTPVNTTVVPQKKSSNWQVVAIVCLAVAIFVGVGTFAVIKIRNFIRGNIITTVPGVDDPAVEDFFEDDDFSFDYNGGFSYDPDNGLNFYHDGNLPFDKDIEDALEEFDVDEFIDEHMDDFDFTPDATYDYSYAEALSFADYMYLEGKGVINDNTVIYGDKTIGGFCDYVDREVLEAGRKIDRRLLYSLLEVHLVDESFYQGDDHKEYFEQSMMYCMLFANEFPNMNMKLDSCMYYSDEPTTYYYVLDIGDKDDTWTVDYKNEKILMNYGTTEYKSAGDYSMFAKKTKMIWVSAIDEYFNLK